MGVVTVVISNFKIVKRFLKIINLPNYWWDSVNEPYRFLLFILAVIMWGIASVTTFGQTSGIFLPLLLIIPIIYRTLYLALKRKKIL